MPRYFRRPRLHAPGRGGLSCCRPRQGWHSKACPSPLRLAGDRIRDGLRPTLWRNSATRARVQVSQPTRQPKGWVHMQKANYGEVALKVSQGEVGPESVGYRYRPEPAAKSSDVGEHGCHRHGGAERRGLVGHILQTSGLSARPPPDGLRRRPSQTYPMNAFGHSSSPELAPNAPNHLAVTQWETAPERSQRSPSCHTTQAQATGQWRGRNHHKCEGSELKLEGCPCACTGEAGETNATPSGAGALLSDALADAHHNLSFGASSVIARRSESQTGIRGNGATLIGGTRSRSQLRLAPRTRTTHFRRTWPVFWASAIRAIG